MINFGVIQAISEQLADTGILIKLKWILFLNVYIFLVWLPVFFKLLFSSLSVLYILLPLNSRIDKIERRANNAEIIIKTYRTSSV